MTAKPPFYLIENCYYHGDLAVGDAQHRVVAHFVNGFKAEAEDYIKYINEKANVEAKVA